MNHVQSKLHGLGVAMVTPFNNQGLVDFPALQRLVELQHEQGCGFLVILGTTGETPTLSADERRRVVDFVLEVNAGRLPVVVGVTGNDTRELCERIATWSDEGISGFLVASPAYNKPQQAGLVKHFEAVADAAPRPVMLYNVPARTGSNMTAETTLDVGQTSQHSRHQGGEWRSLLKLHAFWLTGPSNLAFGQETMHWRCPPLPWVPTGSFLWLATCCQSECP